MVYFMAQAPGQKVGCLHLHFLTVQVGVFNNHLCRALYLTENPGTLRQPSTSTCSPAVQLLRDL